MTFVLELTEKQQERLRRYAAQLGKNPQSVVTEWVDTLPEPQNPAESLPPRVAGLFAGQLWMSDDFNDPCQTPSDWKSGSVTEQLTSKPSAQLRR
jgi:hypothetical protein